MSLPPLSTPVAPQASDKARETQAAHKPPTLADTKQAQNKAILEANLQASFSAQNEPLALLYRTAIDALNQELEPILGENAIERTSEQGVDVSPEATAGRIVSQSTAFFSAFQAQNSDLDPQQQLDRFLEVIGSGVDRGFADAREILDGLQVLEGDIATNIDRTYELVLQGLAEFRDSLAADNESETTV